MHPDTHTTSPAPTPQYGALFVQPVYADGKTWDDAHQDQQDDNEPPPRPQTA